MANSLINKNLLQTPLVDPKTGKVTAQAWIYFFNAIITNLTGGNPSGGSGLLPRFADAEIPSGTINGINQIFKLANIPNPPASLSLFLSGKKLTQGIGYTLSGNAITMGAGYVPNPASGGNIADTLEANYRF